MGDLTIAGRPIPPGQTTEILLKISEFYTSQPVAIPVTVFRGQEEGPVVFLTGAVHGDELNGVAIVRDTITQMAGRPLRGTLICVPVVNRLGFLNHSRYLPDRRDLNRYFPGRPDGHAASRTAWVLFEEIVRKATCGIDLHTARTGRTNLPHVRANMDNPELRRMARAFGTEVIVSNRGWPNSLREAATAAGVPTILLEAGETFKFQGKIVQRGVTGVLNVLVELGMTDGEVVEPRFRVIVKQFDWVRADRGGMLDLWIRPGELVYEGDEVASIRNPFGREMSLLRSHLTGLVIGVTTLPLVVPGDGVAHIARLEKTLPVVEKHRRDGRDREVLPFPEY